MCIVVFMYVCKPSAERLVMEIARKTASLCCFEVTNELTMAVAKASVSVFYIHTYIHACIHTHEYIHTHAYIHTCSQ